MREETQPNREAFLEGLEAVGREVGISVRDEKAELAEKEGKGKGREGKGGEEEDQTVWLHCSVGEPMDDEEIEGEKEKIQVRRGGRVACHAELTPLAALQTTQITPLQGLDRLRDAGFSEEEIASMRAEFRRNAGATVEGGEPRLEGCCMIRR